MFCKSNDYINLYNQKWRQTLACALAIMLRNYFSADFTVIKIFKES